MIIEATHIHKSFGSLEVLKGIDLTVAPREIISIVGASGAGKTTLLQILGTLEAPAEGASLKICGEEVTRLSARRQAELRNRQIGFIFQAHRSSLHWRTLCSPPSSLESLARRYVSVPLGSSSVSALRSVPHTSRPSYRVVRASVSP